MIFKSIRFRIFLIVFLVGIIPTTALIPTFLWAYETISIRSSFQEVLTRAQVFSNEVVSSGYLIGYPNQNLENQIDAVTEYYNGRVMMMDSSLRVVRDSYNADIGKTVVWGNCIKAIKGESLYYFDEKTGDLIVSSPILYNVDDEQEEVVGVIVISRAMGYLSQNINRLTNYCMLAEIIVAAVAMVIALLASLALLRPFKKLDSSLDDIVKEHENRLPDKYRAKEVQRIADKTNSVIDRLKAIDESRQEFVSNVSHELKTPLASMKVLADSINSADDVPVEMYKEFMMDIGTEIDRETDIINDLLTLVRMDKTGAEINIEATDMNELVESVMKRIKPIADAKDVELLYETFRPVTCDVDTVKISLALSNLIENAVKYNNEGGWVHVSLNCDAVYCYITVKDNGKGIDEESIVHIFERFYRTDKSHSSDIPGTGLGLAITKSAVLMHHGEINVQSVLSEGTTFDVKLPLNYVVSRETL